MKRVLSLVLSCIFVLGVCFSTPIVASATGENTFTVENNVFQYNEVSNECSLKKWGDSSVEALTLPDIAEYNANTYTITGVLSGAFSECKNLKTLTIKSNIEMIKAGAFVGCTALTAFIEFESDDGTKNDYFEVVDGVLFNEDKTTLIAYPAGKIDEEGNKVTEYTIPADVKEIAANAFSGASETLVLETSDPAKITQNPDGLVFHKVLEEGGHAVSGYVVSENDIKSVCSCEIELETVATIEYIGSYTDDNSKNWAKEVKVLAKDGEFVSKNSQDAFSTSVTFTQSDKAEDGSVNFYIKKGENAEPVEVTVNLDKQLDSTVPTGVIKLDDSYSWNSLLDNITFGLFFKDAKTVSITSADEDGSGIASIEYYISTEVKTLEGLTALEEIVWTELTLVDGSADVDLKANSKNIVYAKITDNVGNVKYISSDGIILYSDSTTTTKNIEYTKFSNTSVTVNIDLNGNTIKEVKNGDEILKNDSDYTVSLSESGDVAIITFSDTMLDALSTGQQTLTVSYNPLGESYVENQGDAPSDTTINFTINKATPEVTAPKANTLTYNGGEQVLLTAGTTAEGTKFQYKLNNGAWVDVIPTAKDAGTYTVYYKVVGNENYNDVEECSVDVTIAPKTITVTLIQGSGVYNGSAHEPDVDLNDLCENETLAINTDYTVNYANNTNVGTATVTVELMDTLIAKNYTFANNAKTATLNYTIAKGIASINETPIANDLTYTGTEQELVKAGTATGGTMMYSLTGEDDWVSDIPKEKDAGKYTVYYKVVGDANHSDSEVGSIEVEIKKATLTVKSIECSEKTYDGTTDVTVSGIVFDGIKPSDALSYDEEKVKAVADNPAASEAVKVTVSGIELTGDSAKNYEVVSTAETTISIKARTVKITSEDASIIVNAEFPSFVFKADNGLLSGHTLNGGKGVVTEANSSTVIENTATAGEYSVTPSEVKIYAGEADVTANYEITYEAGKLIIKDCTAHEWKDGECTNCHTKCEHKDKSNTIDKQPTCVEEGVLLTKCKICDFVEESTLDKNPDAHKMSDWKETVKATCSSTGTEESVCENGCGHKETRSTEKDPDNHTYGDWVVTEATCVADGEKVKTCTNTECKHELKETIAKDPTAHKMATEWEVTKEPTCVETGLQVKICLNAGCDHEVEEVIAIKADAHNLGGWVVTKAAKCTIAGEITRFCKNGSCEYKVTDSLDPDGETHTFAEDFTIIEATCITAGSKFKACENEGCKEVAEKTEIAINPDAHKNVETINVKEATCEEKGYTGDEHCNDCKKTFEPGIEINAKGHTESDWIVDKEATFTEEGARHTACTVCKKELKKEVIAKRALETPVVKIENAGSGIKVSWSQDEDATGYTVYRSEYNPSTKKWSKWKNRGTAAATKKNWTDKTVKEGVTYRFTVRSVNGDIKSAYKATSGILYVVAPKVTVSITSTGLLAKWNKINNATSYIVYRAELGADGNWGKWVQLGTTKAEKNTWSDDKVKSGVTYKYTVRAVVGKVKSGYTGSSAIIYLEQPLLKIANAANGITGKWEPIAGATGYTIYRSEYNPSTEKWTKWLNLGTTKATAKSFTDKTAKSGYQYKYTIRAVNGKLKSTYQDSNKLVCLAQPTLKISNVANGIQGKWTKVDGATGYIIYRSELKDGKWTKWVSLGTAKSTAKSFTDKTVKSGVQYKYTIRAKNGSSKSSYIDSNTSIFLSVPTVKIANAAAGVKVTWGKIEGATNYLVYRSEYNSSTKKWSKWAELKTVDTTSFVDETAVSNVKYKYTVRALNGEYRSYYKASAELLYLAAPTVTAEKIDEGIKVSWTKIDGAKSYIIYRSELSEDGKWSKWTKLGTASEKYTSCKDKTVKEDVTYKYTVRAVNGKIMGYYVASEQILNGVVTESTPEEPKTDVVA